MQKLFQLFGKIEESKDQTTLNKEGVGLGLIICKKIVENSGGQIRCYSSGEDQGSVFMFSMRMTLPTQLNSSTTRPSNSSGSNKTAQSKDKDKVESSSEDLNVSSRYKVARERQPLKEKSKIGTLEIISGSECSDEESYQSSQRKMKRVRSRLSTIKQYNPNEDSVDDESDVEGDLSIDYEAIELINNLEREEGKR